MDLKKANLFLLSGFYVFAGANHFVNPEFYYELIPDYLPFPDVINLIAGVAEVLLGAGLLFKSTRKWSSYLLVAMAFAKLEYIWLDGYKPTQSLRSKTKIVHDFSGKLEDCPEWSFDGSSTEQATGDSSDCLLKPVAIYEDPEVKNGYLVMTEVLNADGTPHVSNGRASIEDDDNDFWFGFEQEYFIMFRQ